VRAIARDAAIHVKEGRFMGERVKVAKLSELPPGTSRQVQAGGRAVAVFNVDGTIPAIDGTCTHRGGPLGEGELNGKVVTCPWHGGKFDVTTGAVLGPPPQQGVRGYKVLIEGDSIVIEVG
jgi:nitrite reductase/ring-hydroxylating ferredoxin subunit